jgi:hypothetical protein
MFQYSLLSSLIFKSLGFLYFPGFPNHILHVENAFENALSHLILFWPPAFLLRGFLFTA